MAEKSADAFRTISEVAEWLGVQAHVLRFWESKFSQVKPVKRAGGRRYYRPNDMLLIGGIRRLLHEDGLTIKGVQKVLREEGVAHVVALSQPLDVLTAAQVDTNDAPVASEPAPKAASEPAPVSAAPDVSEPAPLDLAPDITEAATPRVVDEIPATAEADLADADGVDASPAPLDTAPPDGELPVASVSDTDLPDTATPETGDTGDTGLASASVATEPASEPSLPGFEAADSTDAPAADAVSELGSAQSVDAPPPLTADPTREPVKKPLIVDAPDGPDEDSLPAAPGVLSHVQRLRGLDAAQAETLLPLVTRLADLRDRLARNA